MMTMAATPSQTEIRAKYHHESRISAERASSTRPRAATAIIRGLDTTSARIMKEKANTITVRGCAP